MSLEKKDTFTSDGQGTTSGSTNHDQDFDIELELENSLPAEPVSYTLHRNRNIKPPRAKGSKTKPLNRKTPSPSLSVRNARVSTELHRHNKMSIDQAGSGPGSPKGITRSPIGSSPTVNQGNGVEPFRFRDIQSSKMKRQLNPNGNAKQQSTLMRAKKMFSVSSRNILGSSTKKLEHKQPSMNTLMNVVSQDDISLAHSEENSMRKGSDLRLKHGDSLANLAYRSLSAVGKQASSLTLMRKKKPAKNAKALASSEFFDATRIDIDSIERIERPDDDPMSEFMERANDDESTFREHMMESTRHTSIELPHGGNRRPKLNDALGHQRPVISVADQMTLHRKHLGEQKMQQHSHSQHFTMRSSQTQPPGQNPIPRRQGSAQRKYKLVRESSFKDLEAYTVTRNSEPATDYSMPLMKPLPPTTVNSGYETSNAGPERPSAATSSVYTFESGDRDTYAANGMASNSSKNMRPLDKTRMKSFNNSAGTPSVTYTKNTRQEFDSARPSFDSRLGTFISMSPPPSPDDETGHLSLSRSLPPLSMSMNASIIPPPPPPPVMSASRSMRGSFDMPPPRPSNISTRSDRPALLAALEQGTLMRNNLKDRSFNESSTSKFVNIEEVNNLPEEEL